MKVGGVSLSTRNLRQPKPVPTYFAFCFCDAGYLPSYEQTDAVHPAFERKHLLPYSVESPLEQFSEHALAE